LPATSLRVRWRHQQSHPCTCALAMFVPHQQSHPRSSWTREPWVWRSRGLLRRRPRWQPWRCLCPTAGVGAWVREETAASCAGTSGNLVHVCGNHLRQGQGSIGAVKPRPSVPPAAATLPMFISPQPDKSVPSLLYTCQIELLLPSQNNCTSRV
jgi:hypothetical protein